MGNEKESALRLATCCAHTVFVVGSCWSVVGSSGKRSGLGKLRKENREGSSSKNGKSIEHPATAIAFLIINAIQYR